MEVIESHDEVEGLAFQQAASFLLPDQDPGLGLRKLTHHAGASCLAVSNMFGQVVFSTDTGTCFVVVEARIFP
jgi:hypothetical protein